jgi:predicted O-methyltransferase YrrM
MKWTEAVENSAHIKRQITERQAQQLFNLAALFNQEGARALDIGTFHGFSASIIAQALSRGHVTTINPREDELVVARKNLARFKNIEVVQALSWEYFAAYDGPLFAFIFVDGHHNQVARDLDWWHRMEAGGLMLFHDYNKPHCKRDSPVVRKVLDDFAARLGRKFDIVAVDETKDVGMVGFYRQEEHAES